MTSLREVMEDVLVALLEIFEWRAAPVLRYSVREV